jgi:hypothetical protein
MNVSKTDRSFKNLCRKIEQHSKPKTANGPCNCTVQSDKNSKRKQISATMQKRVQHLQKWNVIKIFASKHLNWH